MSAATDAKSTSSGGIGFCGLLTIVFITLKLCGVIDWSWWWVVSPIGIPFAAVFLFLVIVFGIGGAMTLIAAAWTARDTRKHRN